MQAKYFTFVDHGDAIELMIANGKGKYERAAYYDKDSKGFIPAIVLDKIVALVKEGYKIAL